MQPLAGTLVADFSWYLPGPFATRELLRLGARVVRVEPPDGDPLRALAPGIEERLNAARLAARIAERPLAEWLALLDGDEVCAGPLLSLEEAAAELGTEPALGAPAALREHTDAWRAELA